MKGRLGYVVGAEVESDPHVFRRHIVRKLCLVISIHVYFEGVPTGDEVYALYNRCVGQDVFGRDISAFASDFSSAFLYLNPIRIAFCFIHVQVITTSIISIIVASLTLLFPYVTLLPCLLLQKGNKIHSTNIKSYSSTILSDK